MTDPWAAPAAIPTEFPTIASLRGRLVLIRPLSQQTVPNNLGGPGATQERITADVTVVDGQGPVPGMSRGNPTGQWFAGPEFPDMWLGSEIVVKQLAEALKTRGAVLARVDTRTPGTAPQKGNPWGLIDPTEQDVQLARNFFANRTVAAASAPAPQQAPVQQPVPAYAQQAPVQQQGQTNPFMAPAQTQAVPPSAPPSTDVNPFLVQR